MTRMGVDAYLGHERAIRYHKNGVSVQQRAQNISHASPNRNIKTARGKTGFLKFI